MSLEIRPLAALYPTPPHTKMCFIVIAGGGMLMPTTFAPLSVLSNIWVGGGGYNAARGLMSRALPKIHSPKQFHLQSHFEEP